MIIKRSILTLSPIDAQGVPLITNVTPNKGTYPNISKSTAKEYLLRKRDKGELIEVKVKRALSKSGQPLTSGATAAGIARIYDQL